ncbi:MAG: hypothetical protein JWO03_1710 [Bacteroidetes bacterium]|nr:hypothetical protein [Bacteroidota bacterium]
MIFDNLIKSIKDNTVKVGANDIALYAKKENNTFKILDKKPFLGGNSFSTYVVNTDHWVRHDLKCNISSMENSMHSFDLHINYEIRIAAGDEKRALNFFLEQDTQVFSSAFNAALENWILEYVRTYPHGFDGFMERFFEDTKPLREFLQSKVKIHGITMNLSIATVADEPESTVKGTLHVKPNDQTEYVDIRYVANINVFKPNKLKSWKSTSRRSETEKEQILKSLMTGQSIKKLFESQIYYKSIVDDLNGSVKSKVIDSLNDLLNQEGWAINELTLFYDRPRHEIQNEIQHKTECAILNYTKGLSINHTILVSLDDVGKFNKANLSGPEAVKWLKAELDKEVRSSLLRKTFSEVVLSFSTYADQIECVFQEKAQSIGLTVKQIISRPELPDWDIVFNSFTIDLPFQKYNTRDTSVYAYIEIKCKLHLNLESRKLKSLIIPGVNIREVIESTIRETAQRVLLKISPEDYYLNFMTSIGDLPSVEDRLKQQISDAIIEQLGLRDGSREQDNLPEIVIRLDTNADALSRRARKLIAEGDMGFILNLSSNAERGRTDSVQYKITYYITQVDPEKWHTFAGFSYPYLEDTKEATVLRDPEFIAKIFPLIEDTLRDNMTALLENKSNEVLRYTDDNTKAGLEMAEALNICEGMIRNKYGLVIRFNLPHRLATQSERFEQKATNIKLEMQANYTVADFKDKLEEKRELEKEVRSLQIKNPGAPEIKIYKKRIQELEEKYNLINASADRMLADSKEKGARPIDKGSSSLKNNPSLSLLDQDNPQIKKLTEGGDTENENKD